MAGPTANIRSASRDSSWAISATGTRSSVIRSSAPPILKKEYTAAMAPRTTKAEMPKKASSRRPRTPNLVGEEVAELASDTDPLALPPNAAALDEVSVRYQRAGLPAVDQ